MENQKNLLVEINRMKEIMGIRVLSEAVTPTYVKEFLEKALGVTEKQIDNLEKEGVDLSDFTKISDDFARLGIKNINDLSEYAAKKLGVNIDVVSDDVLLKFMKESPEVTEAINRKLGGLINKAARDIVQAQDFKNLVGDDLADNILNNVLGTGVNSQTADSILIAAQTYKREIDDAIQTQTSKGNTIPDSLKEISEQLGEKIKQVENFKNNYDVDYSYLDQSLESSREMIKKGEQETADEIAKLEREFAEKEKEILKIAEKDRLVKEVYELCIGKNQPIFKKLKRKQQKAVYDAILLAAKDSNQRHLLELKGDKVIREAYEVLETAQKETREKWERRINWVKDNKITSALIALGILAAAGFAPMYVLGYVWASTGGSDEFKKGKEAASGTEESSGEYTEDLDGFKQFITKEASGAPGWIPDRKDNDFILKPNWYDSNPTEGDKVIIKFNYKDGTFVKQ